MPEVRETRNEPIRPFRDVARAGYQEPEPVRDFRSEPDRMRDYRSEPEPMRDYRSEPEPIRDFRPEPVRDTYRIEPALSAEEDDGDPEAEPEPAQPRSSTRRSPRRRGDPQPNT
jgi:hypothetical protein